MNQTTLIKKHQAFLVDLGNKKILKYTSPEKNLEINHMFINGRHPKNPEHFIYETEIPFMVYVLKGNGKIYWNDDVFEVEPGDVVDVPIKTKFAAEGNDFEYLAFESPAWYPEQAFIVDKDGKVIEQTKR